MSAPNILILEEDEEAAGELQSSLELEGYEVMVQAGGPVGLAAARSPEWDLLITASEVKGRDHLAFIDSLRREERRLPILVLASDGSMDEQVRALRAGADDWVPRPWGDLELVARVEALLRRARRYSNGASDPSTNGSRPDEPRRIFFSDVEVRPAHRVVLKGGEPVSLTPKELDLLLALIQRDGAVATRGELLSQVWGYPASVRSRTLDTHMSELRRKLENDPSTPRHLITVRKVGYRWAR
jgi:two-component system, OmpR family, alkaline phosphatase synthesis response regulator PhoP